MDDKADIKHDLNEVKPNSNDEESAEISLNDSTEPDPSPEIDSNNVSSHTNCETGETETKINNTECDVETINAENDENTENSPEIDPEAVISVDITPEKDGGVLKKILKEGEGDEFPGYGDRVLVHYTGWRLGKEPVEFDSSRKGDKFEFNLGRGKIHHFKLQK